jgi:hypothetical protein
MVGNKNEIRPWCNSHKPEAGNKYDNAERGRIHCTQVRRANSVVAEHRETMLKGLSMVSW